MAEESDPIFDPLEFKNLTVKNRIFRSSISGKFDNYDGSGPTQSRINWEEKFARGGVGAIITSYVPVAVRGRICTNYAMIDRDERISDWARLIEQIHHPKYDGCKFIIQLSNSGRQRDEEGIDNHLQRVVNGQKAFSSTSQREPIHGFPCQAMTRSEIEEMVNAFGEGARRAKAAGADGIETHSSNGYLFNQFLSSGINDRKDEYGGTLVNRARFLMYVVRAIRGRVGNTFHFQVKISARDRNNAVLWWEKPGNELEESITVCQWLETPERWAIAANEQASKAKLPPDQVVEEWRKVGGADAIHVSSGSMFPHPLNPPGEFPLKTLARSYETVASSGEATLRNLVMFQFAPGRWLFAKLWNRIKQRHPGYALNVPPAPKSLPPGDMQERLHAYQGVTLADARTIKQSVGIPVLCTGGFQQASYIRRAIAEGFCDAVTIARSLIANNNLPMLFRQGLDLPEKPCTYCNECLLHAIRDPLGCYDVRRYGGNHQTMMNEIYSVYRPTFAGRTDQYVP